MAHLPNPATHIWSDLVVGGATPDPVILKLTEQNLIDNGDFEEVLVNWDTAVRLNAGSNAMKGNYVIDINGGDHAATYISKGSNTKLLFTGFIKVVTPSAGKKVLIKVYNSANTSRIASPTADTFIIYIASDDAAITSNNWIPFYSMVDLSSWSDSYIHFEIECESGVHVYFDDFRIYPVNEVLEMNEPNTMKLSWQRITDANYEMLDGSIKDYLKGWRPNYSLGYEYCSREELIRHIGLSESMFNFFIPHGDNMQGDYVRMNNDFDNSYFNDRYIGHSQEVMLQGIFLRKFKNREYGDTYFTVATDPTPPPVIITDIDGNIYTSIIIGGIEWLIENLKTTKFNDGSPIPLVTDNSAWAALITPGYCWYSNDIGNKNPYGGLYNWYSANDIRLAPTGWRVATKADFAALSAAVIAPAGGALKEIGITHWDTPNTGATNSSGWTGLPGGYRTGFTDFSAKGSRAFFWASDEDSPGVSFGKYLYSWDAGFDDAIGNLKSSGYSIRCCRTV